MKQNDLSLLTRALIWLLNRQPDIEHILVDPTIDHDDEPITYIPDNTVDYWGKDSHIDRELKREYLEHCWNRTPPPKRP